tara:strand:- start:618 stop:1241 length:624 start_codon:yes stop_codon:yes gene_type:complete
MSKIFYDSPSSENFTAPVRTTKVPRRTFPFRTDLTAVIYTEDYIQKEEYFVPSPLDLTHPDYPSAYLVNETAPASRGDGLVKFSRVFATVPAARTEWAKSSYEFPAYKEDFEAANDRNGWSQTVILKMNFSYLLTTDPSNDLTITAKWKPTDVNDNLCSYVATDTTPTQATYAGYVTAETYLQAEETAISRWKGNIWQMLNRETKAL